MAKKTQRFIYFSDAVEDFQNKLSLPETEDSWNQICSCIISFNAICNEQGDQHHQEIIQAIRFSSRPLDSALQSERTRLSGAAIELVNTIVTVLAEDFSPLLMLVFPTLLALCGRTNKVLSNRSRACVFTVIEIVQAAIIIPYFLSQIKDKSAPLRLVAAEGTLKCLNCFNPAELEKEARVKDIEGLIRATATDASADVRRTGKQIFEAYKQLLPSRVDTFTAPLTPTIKKYLDVTGKSNTANSFPTARPIKRALTEADPRTRVVSTSHSKPPISLPPSKMSIDAVIPNPQVITALPPVRSRLPPQRGEPRTKKLVEERKPVRPRPALLSQSTSAITVHQRTASASSIAAIRPLARSLVGSSSEVSGDPPAKRSTAQRIPVVPDIIKPFSDFVPQRAMGPRKVVAPPGKPPLPQLLQHVVRNSRKPLSNHHSDGAVPLAHSRPIRNNTTKPREAEKTQKKPLNAKKQAHPAGKDGPIPPSKTKRDIASEPKPAEHNRGLSSSVKAPSGLCLVAEEDVSGEERVEVPREANTAEIELPCEEKQKAIQIIIQTETPPRGVELTAEHVIATPPRRREIDFGVTKTPISRLLLSIQQGFEDLSPTPLIPSSVCSRGGGDLTNPLQPQKSAAEPEVDGSRQALSDVGVNR